MFLTLVNAEGLRESSDSGGGWDDHDGDGGKSQQPPQLISVALSNQDLMKVHEAQCFLNAMFLVIMHGC